ncbi:MAG: lipase/acyltransferase domain-containing protein [Desulfobulbaceae bacterium]
MNKIFTKTIIIFSSLITSFFITTDIALAELIWQTSKSSTVNLALNEGKKILLIAGRDSCAYTNYMRYTVCHQTSPPIQNLIQQQYIPWYVDVDFSTEWYTYASGLTEFMLPLICVIDPQDSDNYLDRTTGLQAANDFYSRLDAYDSIPSSSPHFIFSPPLPASVQPGTLLSVQVVAVDAANQVMTTFTGQLTLNSGAPMRIYSREQSNGITTFSISFPESYSSNQLHAQSGDMFGASNVFAVGTGSVNKGAIKGRVVYAGKAPASSVTVYLKAFGSPSEYSFSATTAYDGSFLFTNIYPGYYLVWVNSINGPGESFSKYIDSGITNLGTLKAPVPKPPVILVPGFMGSDKKWAGGVIFPKLPQKMPADQEDLKIHDPGEIVDTGPGWDDLQDELEAAGFEVYPCPWDWRYAPNTGPALNYLWQCIDKATKETGAIKVDIVAHSMGGLLVRNYIQMRSGYRNDIDRFAMVGTPNHGALLAYPGWAGGDPVLADLIGGSSGADNGGAEYFYSHTLDRLYKTMEGRSVIDFSGCGEGLTGHCGAPILTKDRPTIKNFLENKVKGLGSLLITDYYCLQKGGTCGKISEHRDNDFLINLNQDPDLSRLKDGTVTTKIFASKSEAVVKNVNVGLADLEIFADGEPQQPFIYTNSIGDGTVLYESALLSGVPTHSSVNKGKHAFLINAFRKEILDFLKEGRVLASPVLEEPSLLNATQVNTQLSVNVDNGYAALLTGPDNARNGIDLEGVIDYEESSGSIILRDNKNASVTLVNPVDGIYEVKLTGNLPGVSNVIVSWFGLENQNELEIDINFTPPATTFRFKVTSTSDPVLSLVKEIGSPQNIISKNINGNTTIQWSPPSTGTAVSYNVYSRQDFQNVFELLETVNAPATSLVTSHTYNEPRIVYGVSAVDSLGNESTLSEIIDNQPVVYTVHEYKRFPWPMLLPAITRPGI